MPAGTKTAIVLFGAPGSGKGTQAKLLENCLHVPQISTGDMLRYHVTLGDDLGREVKALLASGSLVGDELVNRLVVERIGKPDAAQGFLLDGYPRTLDQAKSMRAMLAERQIEPVVIHLKVDYNEVILRMAGRRVCPVCGTLYNLVSKPPKVEGVCDHEGALLILREDDREPVIRRRMAEYDTQTRPLIDYFRREGVPYHELESGTGTPDAIAARICALLKPAAVEA